MDREELRIRLTQALKLRDKKAVDLSKDLDIPKSAISQYLSGKSKNMTADRLYDIAKYLDVSEAWLMGYDVPMERGAALENKLYDLAKDKQILDLLSRMTDAEKQELLDYMKYLISKRKDT